MWNFIAVGSEICGSHFECIIILVVDKSCWDSMELVSEYFQRKAMVTNVTWAIVDILLRIQLFVYFKIHDLCNNSGGRSDGGR